MFDDNLGSKYLLKLVFPAFLSTYLELLLLFYSFVKQVCPENSLYFFSSHSFSKLKQYSRIDFFAELGIQEDSGLLWYRFGLNLHHNLINSLSVSVTLQLISLHHISTQSITS